MVDFDNDGRLDLYEANGRVGLQGETFAADPYAEPNLLFRGVAGAAVRGGAAARRHRRAARRHQPRRRLRRRRQRRRRRHPRRQPRRRAVPAAQRRAVARPLGLVRRSRRRAGGDALGAVRDESAPAAAPGGATCAPAYSYSRGQRPARPRRPRRRRRTIDAVEVRVARRRRGALRPIRRRPRVDSRGRRGHRRTPDAAPALYCASVIVVVWFSARPDSVCTAPLGHVNRHGGRGDSPAAQRRTSASRSDCDR